MILLGLVEIFGWDLLHANINTLVSFEVVGLHSQKINHTFEVLLQAHGDVHAHRILGQTIKDRSIRSLIVCPHTIELIDETKSWHILLISITPIGLTLRLHSGHSVKNYNCSVEDTQASLYFNSKVYVPRSINYVKLVSQIGISNLSRAQRGISICRIPEAGNSSSGNSNATLALLLHPVGHCITLMDLANLMRLSCIEKYSFRHGGFPSVNMRNNPEIARLL